MSRDWVSRLEDIVECGTKIATYTGKLTVDEFRSNELVFDAVVRNLELICEAASGLPAAVTATMPGAEWSRAAAFREVIRRDRFGLDHCVVWDLAQTHIPHIVHAASTALASSR